MYSNPMLSATQSISSVHPDALGITLPGKTQAVLCLHGFTATPQTFSELALQIHQQSNFHVHAPLLPGHGTTYQDLDTVSYDQWIDAAQKAYTSLEQQFASVHLVGLSMGATLCQMLAQKNPARTSSISMMAPALHLSSKLLQYFMHFIQRLPKKILSHMIIRKHTPIENYISYQRYSLAGVEEIFRLFQICQQELCISHIPCLIQTPEKDQVIDPNSSAIIAKYYSDVETICYPNTPHVMVYADQKKEIFAKIIRHIQMCA